MLFIGLILMADYEGFCLKCKTYGPIKDVQHYSMANGRKRVGGTCSQPGCTGKISKIVGWFHFDRTNHPNTKLRTRMHRARGLGVMTSPWHGEDRQFNSGRAHSSCKIALLYPFSLGYEGAITQLFAFLASKRVTESLLSILNIFQGPITWIIGTNGVLDITQIGNDPILRHNNLNYDIMLITFW